MKTRTLVGWTVGMGVLALASLGGFILFLHSLYWEPPSLLHQDLVALRYKIAHPPAKYSAGWKVDLLRHCELVKCAGDALQADRGRLYSNEESIVLDAAMILTYKFISDLDEASRRKADIALARAVGMFRD